MSKKVLYINFNIIMHPFMNMYSHHISKEDMTPNEAWEHLNRELNLYEFIHYDADTLMSLAGLLNRFANKKNFQQTIAPADLLISLAPEDEIVYVDFEDSFKSALCEKKTWIRSIHSKNKYDSFAYLLNDLTQFFETKHKFDEVYFYFPPKQVPHKYYHLYQLIRKYSLKR